MNAALTGTVHDPAGLQLPILARAAPCLRQYAGVYLAVSPTTDPQLVEALIGDGVRIVPGGSEIGVARRAALAAAHAAGHDAFLAIDFDRWLHWAIIYPDELAAVPQRLARQRPRRWYACLGRTARAFATHPDVQRLTETVSNAAASRALGRRIDAVAGASWLSRQGADLVLAQSIETTNATDLEWPALISLVEPRRIGQLFCEGLEFETATFHHAAIAAAGGIAAWTRQTYDHPASWRDRAQLSTDSIAALARVLGTSTPAAAPPRSGDRPTPASGSSGEPPTPSASGEPLAPAGAITSPGSTGSPSTPETDLAGHDSTPGPSRHDEP